MHRLQYPLLPEYGYSFQASVRHVQGNRLLQEKPVRFLRYKHVCHLRLPVFSDVQMLHSYRLYNRFPCCFSHIFHVLYCDIHLYYEVRHTLLFSLPQLFYISFLLPMLQHLLLLPAQIPYLSPYFYPYVCPPFLSAVSLTLFYPSSLHFIHCQLPYIT